MAIIQMKMSKEEFVDRMMEDIQEKKRREHELKMVYKNYVSDRVAKSRKKYRRRK